MDGLFVAITPVAVLWFVLLMIFSADRRVNCGFWIWQRESFRRTGLKGTGVVLESIERGAGWTSPKHFQAVESVVEVTVPGQPSFRVSITRDVSKWTTDKGKTFPVVVDPKNHERVMIDLKEIKRAEAAAVTATRDAAEANKRKLLDQK